MAEQFKGPRWAAPSAYHARTEATAHLADRVRADVRADIIEERRARAAATLAAVTVGLYPMTRKDDDR